MKFAFVFPGQGSQSVGMFNGFESHQGAKQVLDEASTALGTDLSALIAEGPIESLNLTTNTQPCMLACAYAFYRAWRDEGGAEPSLFAGHSLGEYTALTAAGAFQLSDAVKLVRYRAEVMQEAVPVGAGGMAAILGLEDQVVRELCAKAAQGEVVEAVNFNAPAQVVIAGHKAAVERACQLAKELGAKRALTLPVSAPFHSSLLKPASDKLRSRLSDTPLQAPSVPVVNNVDVAQISDVAGIRDALARQAASPVRWVETIQAMVDMEVTHVIECGPGKVLTGLTKRIAPGLTSLSISDPVSLRQVLEVLA